jgi:hypothetical protein
MRASDNDTGSTINAAYRAAFAPKASLAPKPFKVYHSCSTSKLMLHF